MEFECSGQNVCFLSSNIQKWFQCQCCHYQRVTEFGKLLHTELGLLNVLVNSLITNICLYGTINSNICYLTWCCFKHLDYWSRSFSALSSWSCFILSFSGLLLSSLETSILGHLPLFPKLLCGFIISTVFPPVCTPSEKEHSVPFFSSVWAFCFHVLTRKPTHSCAKTERNTEVWTHYREFSHFKGTQIINSLLNLAGGRSEALAQQSCSAQPLLGLNMLCPFMSPLFLGSGRGQAGFIKLNNTQAQKAINESSQHLKIIEPGPKPCSAVNIDVPPTMKGWWILRKEWGNNLTKNFYSCSLRGVGCPVFFYQEGKIEIKSLITAEILFLCVCVTKTVL